MYTRCAVSEGWGGLGESYSIAVICLLIHFGRGLKDVNEVVKSGCGVGRLMRARACVCECVCVCVGGGGLRGC